MSADQKSRMRHVRQTDENDCGLAAIASIASIYGLHTTVASLRHKTGHGREMTTLAELKGFALRLGLQARWYRVQDARSIPSSALPAIVHLKHGHYVVAESRWHRWARISDPSGFSGWRSLRTLETTGYIMSVRPGDDIQGTPPVKLGFSRLAAAGMSARRRLMLIVGVSILTTLVALTFSQLLRVLVEIVDRGGVASEIDSVVIYSAAIAIFLGTLRAVAASITFEGSVSIDRRLAGNYYRTLTKMPASFYGRYTSGDLVTRFTDVARVREFLQSGVAKGILGMTAALGGGGFLIWVDTVLGLLVCGLMLAGGVITWFAGRRLERMLWSQAQADGRLTHTLFEGVNAALMSRGVRAEEFMQRRLAAAYDTFFTQARGLFRATTVITTAVSVWENVTYALVLGLCATEVLAGTTSLGTLMSFAILVPVATGGMTQLVETRHDLQGAIVASDRIAELDDLVPIVSESRQGQETVTVPADRFIRTVESLRVSRGSVTICAVDAMEVRRGEVLGLLGGNGSGKTTLCLTLAGLETEWTGRLGAPASVGTTSGEILRTGAAYVPSASPILRAALIENIMLGRPAPPDFHEILELSGVGEIARRLPRGLKTEVGDDGVRLSAGQAQRVAFARALVGEPELLILDEALQMVDPESRNAMLTSARERMRDGAIILVAHDEHAMDACDRVAVMTMKGIE